MSQTLRSATNGETNVWKGLLTCTFIFASSHLIQPLRWLTRSALTSGPERSRKDCGSFTNSSWPWLNILIDGVAGVRKSHIMSGIPGAGIKVPAVANVTASSFTCSSTIWSMIANFSAWLISSYTWSSDCPSNIVWTVKGTLSAFSLVAQYAFTRGTGSLSAR